MPKIKITSTGEQIKSGIASTNVKTRIRDISRIEAQYPTIVRTGPPNRKGNFNIHFDDQETIVFGEHPEVGYSTNSISGSEVPIVGSAAYASPNSDSGGIFGRGFIKSGIADNYYLRGYKELARSRYHDFLTTNKEALNYNPESADHVAIHPFDETRINLKDTQFYKTGTLSTSVKGFSNPLQNKTQIVIDMTPSEDALLYRLDTSIAGLDPLGEFHNKPNTGFMYYNFDLNRWEQTGNFDTEAMSQGPAFNLFSGDYNRTTSMFATITGSDRVASQFSASPHFACSSGRFLRDGFGIQQGLRGVGDSPDTDEVLFLYKQLGYENIGKPTMSMQAPASSRYYATGSQTLKMKDHIHAPFVLEKIVAEFPVAYKRIQSASFNEKAAIGLGTIAQRRVHITGSALRDMDNFSFFAYRQTSPNAKDDSESAKYSRRSIIFSGSICFFNGNSMFPVFDSSKQVPMHSPAFQYDMSMALGTLASSNSEKIVTASVVLEIKPGICSNGYIGCTHFLNEADTSESNGTGAITIPMQHYWPGGTSTPRYITKPETFGNSYTESGGFDQVDFGRDINPTVEINVDNRSTSLTQKKNLFSGYGEFEYNGGSFSATSFTNIDSKNNLVADPRTLNSSFGTDSKTAKFASLDTFNNGGFTFVSQTGPEVDEITITDTPYILFPEDEIIFGMDAGISYNPDMFHGDKNDPFDNLTAGTADRSIYTTITGSHMRILSSKPSKVVFYGSQIVNEKEFHDTLNQHLTSEEVHEPIGYDESICRDKFFVNNRYEFSGSYIDDFATGSIGSKVKSLLGSGGNALSGSFQNFLSISSTDDRYYDSYLPDPVEMYKADGYIPHESQNQFSVGLGELSHLNGFDQYHGFWNQIFPFEPRYLNVQRSVSRTVGIAGVLFANGNLRKVSFLGTTANTQTKISDLVNTANTLLFGFGNDPQIQFSSSSFRPTSDNGNFARFERPVGLKYGLLNFKPQTRKMYFRSNSFGQSTDLIEQGLDGRFYDTDSNTTLQSPVFVDFVVPQEGDTTGLKLEVLNESEILKNDFYSSNVSLYATSSLPFFDDSVTRNRNYEQLRQSSFTIEIE